MLPVIRLTRHEVYISCRSPRYHADCISNYSDAVLSGEIIAGRYVPLAVERHLDDLEHAHQRGLHFDAEIHGKSLRFVEAVCTHQKAEWAGKPFLMSPNQQFILWTLDCSRTCVVLTCFTEFPAIAPPNL